MAIIFQDTFTEASNTPITSHTPDVGDGWTTIDTAETVRIEVNAAANDMRPDGASTTDGHAVTADATYISADYQVRFTLKDLPGSSDEYLRILARYQNNTTFYSIDINNNSSTDPTIRRGQGTTLVTHDNSVWNIFAVNDVVTFQVYGTEIACFGDDEVAHLYVIDSNITLAGKAGVAMGGVLGASGGDMDATHQRIDDFEVETLAETFDGWNDPTTTGETDNDFTNPTNAYAAGGSQAGINWDAGTGSYAQDYGDFGLSILSGSTIRGISVKVASQTDTSGWHEFAVSVSQDNGATWSAEKIIRWEDNDGSPFEKIAGHALSLWGLTWDDTDFSDANFRVRIRASGTEGSTIDDATLDHVAVKVYYDEPTGTEYTQDCDEIVTTTDSITPLQAYLRTLTEALPVVDVLSPIKSFVRTLVEAVTGVDNVNAFVPRTAPIAKLKGNTHSGGTSDMQDLTTGSPGILDFDDEQELNEEYFGWSAANPGRLVINKSGDYLFSVTLPYTSNKFTNASRNALGIELYKNGSKVDVGWGRSGYIRNGANHNQSSLHLAVMLEGCTINDYFEVKVYQYTTDNGNALTSDGHALTAIALEGVNYFSATGTQTIAGTNLNTTVSEMDWSAEIHKGDNYTHSTVTNPEEITLAEAGLYLVCVNIPLSGAIARGNIAGKILIDGSQVGTRFQQGYIRNANAHTSSSIHYYGIVETTSANQVLSVSVEQESVAGTITTGGEKATIGIAKLTSEGMFVGTATQAGGADEWHPSTPQEINIATETEKDTDVYTHSTVTDNPTITVAEDGDYLVGINASFTSSSTTRPNPKIRVLVNDVEMDLEAKSGYIRNGSSVDDSSSDTFLGILVLQAGDEVLFRTRSGGRTGTVDDVEPFQAFLWKVQTPGTLYTQSLDDALSATAALGAFVVGKLMTEVVTITDNVLALIAKAFVEVVSAIDRLTFTFQSFFTEVVAVADTFGTEINKFFTETVPVTATLTKAGQFLKALDESIGLSDTLSRTMQVVLTATVTVVASVVALFSKSFTEVLSVADDVWVLVSRSFTETLTATASLIRQVYASFIEVVPVADVIVSVFSKAFTETVAVADNLLASISKGLTEVVSATDRLLRQVTRSLVEEITTSDVVTKSLQYGAQLSESVGLTAALSKVGVFFKTLSDAVGVNDNVSIVGVFYKALTDTVTAVASVFKVVGREIGESVGLTATVVPISVYIRQLSEELTVEAVLSRTIGKAVVASVTVVDVVNSVISRTLTETVALSAFVFKAVGYRIAEAVALSDTLQRSMTRVFTEGVTVVASVSRLIARSLAEGVTMGAVMARSMTKRLDEVVGLSDTFTKIKTQFVNLSESIGLSDLLESLYTENPYPYVKKTVQTYTKKAALITKRIIRPFSKGSAPYTRKSDNPFESRKD